MATIRDTVKDNVKIFIYRNTDSGEVVYSTIQLVGCSWLVLVGETTTTVEYDESDLIGPCTAQLAAAEQALEQHRAESAVKEQQLLDRIQSLKALTHEGDGGRSEPLD